jgi:hypothetical protein
MSSCEETLLARSVERTSGAAVCTGFGFARVGFAAYGFFVCFGRFAGP